MMLPFTRHGLRELLIGGVVLALLGAGLGAISGLLSLIVLPALIFLFAFFRDPERAVPVEQHSVVSPADGTVSDITELDFDPLINGPAVRVGIFLSVFNVHVNRSPCDGRVLSVTYKKGKFINAMRHNEASDENESNTIVLAEPNGERPIAVVKQIVGLIARRIVCTTVAGEQVKRGDRIGMIKFGSRTEVTLAKFLDPQIKVKVGQTVKGAADVIAMLNNPIHTTAMNTGGKDGSGEESEPLLGRETPA
jgi:phosphatidylserine decarboxylase